MKVNISMFLIEMKIILIESCHSGMYPGPPNQVKDKDYTQEHSFHTGDSPSFHHITWPVKISQQKILHIIPKIIPKDIISHSIAAHWSSIIYSTVSISLSAPDFPKAVQQRTSHITRQTITSHEQWDQTWKWYENRMRCARAVWKWSLLCLAKLLPSE